VGKSEASWEKGLSQGLFRHPLFLEGDVVARKTDTTGRKTSMQVISKPKGSKWTSKGQRVSGGVAGPIKSHTGETEKENREQHCESGKKGQPGGGGTQFKRGAGVRQKNGVERGRVPQIEFANRGILKTATNSLATATIPGEKP